MIDPICNMEVDETNAAGQYVYRGQTYLFCSVPCLEKFKQDPEQFLESSLTAENIQHDESVATDPVCGMAVKPGTAA